MGSQELQLRNLAEAFRVFVFSTKVANWSGARGSRSRSMIEHPAQTIDPSRQCAFAWALGPRSPGTGRRCRRRMTGDSFASRSNSPVQPHTKQASLASATTASQRGHRLRLSRVRRGLDCMDLLRFGAFAGNPYLLRTRAYTVANGRVSRPRRQRASSDRSLVGGLPSGTRLLRVDPRWRGRLARGFRRRHDGVVGSRLLARGARPIRATAQGRSRLERRHPPRTPEAGPLGHVAEDGAGRDGARWLRLESLGHPRPPPLRAARVAHRQHTHTLGKGSRGR